ncbi:hypothetical protein RIF29_19348 [Crotalaria pallida]|uniref:Uncharacterized protein n=1 Tax=Crotalaria pallida TaxID=3830 RepID=A0AAN9F375_CROPI
MTASLTAAAMAQVGSGAGFNLQIWHETLKLLVGTNYVDTDALCSTPVYSQRSKARAFISSKSQAKAMIYNK